MARAVQVRVAPVPSIILISGFEGNVVRWPGPGGITTVYNLGPASAPMVYHPGTRLVYWFGQSGYTTTIYALNPILGGSTLITSFQCIPSPVTLGGAHPTAPFMADPRGGDGIPHAGLPSVVTAAASIGDAIYLGCHGSPGIAVIKTLVRFTPSTGSAEIVHGPFQPTQYRTYLWPPIIGGVYYVYDLNGYAGDAASPGFITELGGNIYWSAGAFIFQSTSGDTGSWSLIYDGMGGDKYLAGAQTYGRHQPGVIDPLSGSYLFGATGQHVTSTEASDSPGFFQSEPYTVADATNPNPDGPRFRSIPTVSMAEESITPISGGSFRVPTGFYVAGGLSHQPVSRGVLALDAGGGVTVVYEDTREDLDIGRAEMGPIAGIWNGASLAGIGAVSSGWTDWTSISAVPPVVPTFASAGAGWANDPISSGIFLLNHPFDDNMPPTTPFGYGGQLYALHAAAPDGGTQLVVRDGSGAWSTVTATFGVSYDSFAIQEVNPPFSVVSTSARLKV